ncbi:hypothetical protein [Paenibacillus andongensis]|uniref:hypothetical protein n=1 Tax=Paenibacillus andongensis TaxID=2975482 RepID=UPI00346271F7
MIDTKMLEEHVIKPMLTSVTRETFSKELGDLKSEMISIGTTDSSTKVYETIRNLLSGFHSMSTEVRSRNKRGYRVYAKLFDWQ